MIAATGAAAGGWAVTCLLLSRIRLPHLRENYRGRQVVATLGVVLAGAVAFGGLVAGALAWAGEASVREAVAVAGAGLLVGGLGWLDDTYGDRSAGGFVGHLRALFSGRVTTGLVKAVGGGAAGLGAAWFAGLRGWWILAGGALIALGANLVNLLDLRPGRALKAWMAACVALLVAGATAAGIVVTAALAGGAVAFLPSDLRERGMLGDVGANLLGATLAAAAAVSISGTALLVLLGALAALTLASELVSFSAVIERVRPLRAIDRWGRTG